MEEVWKDIKGFEGAYQISSLGRVRSLPGKYRKELIRKLVPDKDGYLECMLCEKGKYTHKKVHRLVGEAFIKNPFGKKEINHKNGNRADNRIENLEWVSRKENEHHKSEVLHSSPTTTVRREDGKVYHSIKEAAEENKVNPTSIMQSVKIGCRSNGYHWEYVKRAFRKALV
jgi:hypothetical protein